MGEGRREGKGDITEAEARWRGGEIDTEVRETEKRERH